METSDATGPQWHDTLFTNKGTGERVSAILDQDAEDRRLGKKPGDSESFAVLGEEFIFGGFFRDQALTFPRVGTGCTKEGL